MVKNKMLRNLELEFFEVAAVLGARCAKWHADQVIQRGGRLGNRYSPVCHWAIDSAPSRTRGIGRDHREPARDGIVMRKLSALLTTVAGCMVLLAAEASFAQAPSPSNRQYPARYQPSRPTVSPYLNLFRNGNSAAMNYQTLVRPQINQENTNQQERTAVQRLQRQLGDVSQTVYGAAAARSMRTTGHRTVFLDYSHYYTTGSPRR
jgi:hypothetical protein